MTENKKQWKRIDIPASGKRGMDGGAFSMTYVYSNKGNFLLVGYMREVKAYLENLKEKEGLKYFANYCLYNRGKKREIWYFYKNNVYIYEPKYRPVLKGFSNGWKFKNHRTDAEISFRRLPKRWVKEFDNL